MQPTHTMAQYNSNRNKNKSYSTLVPFTYQPTTSQSHNERDYALLIWKNFSKPKEALQQIIYLIVINILQIHGMQNGFQFPIFFFFPFMPGD